MSVGPRIVFTRFASGAHSKLRPWQEHVRRVAGSLPVTVGTADNDASVVVWSLLSANNRDLGHGAKIYHHFDEAVIDARAAILERSNLQVRLVRGDRDRIFGWSLADDGTIEMVCPRWYRTDRERQHSINLATMALPIATLGDGVHLARSSSAAAELTHPSS
jgi:hypothetical protein